MEIVNEYIKRVDKLWGTEYWIANCDLYCLKYLILLPGRCSSLHSHKEKDETFYIDHGIVNLQLCDETVMLHQGQSVRILPGQIHKFWNAGLEEAVIVEVSTHHDDKDVQRLENSKVL